MRGGKIHESVSSNIRSIVACVACSRATILNVLEFTQILIAVDSIATGSKPGAVLIEELVTNIKAKVLILTVTVGEKSVVVAQVELSLATVGGRRC